MILFINNDEKSTVRHRILKGDKYSYEDRLYLFYVFDLTIFDYSEKVDTFNQMIAVMYGQNTISKYDLFHLMCLSADPLVAFTKKSVIKKSLEIYYNTHLYFVREIGENNSEDSLKLIANGDPISFPYYSINIPALSERIKMIEFKQP